jgi:hypothetical protein
MKLKQTLSVILLACVITACTTSQQNITHNTLKSVEQGVIAAVDSYDTAVIKGTLPTNDVPRVSRIFNIYQASYKIAIDAARYNSNAIAPPNLVVEAQDVVNLITTITGKK